MIKFILSKSWNFISKKNFIFSQFLENLWTSMIKFIYFAAIIYSLRAFSLKESSSFLVNSSKKHSSKIGTSKLILTSLTPDNDFICIASTEIKSESFSDIIRIKSDVGCQSISIIKCTFDKITINPENSQLYGQFSIIYVKENDLLIDESTFQECSSKSPISSSSIDYTESNFLTCHIVFIDKNPNHDVTINNCDFLDNGLDSESDGTIIFSNRAKNIEISFCQFKSDKRFTRAFQSIYTPSVILSYNTFFKMTGPIGQNGGALLIQFSSNVSISDCVFDSNNLQPNSMSNDEIFGSSFFVNLNDTFFFTNNTIQNHDIYINSVIAFNTNKVSNKIFILNSSFINNKYSKSFDGSGIGFLAKDDESVSLNIVFLGCTFSQNGEGTSSGLDSAAGVFGWSREASSLSFISCNFESNNVLPSSSLISIQNGNFLLIENCTINEPIKYSVLTFQPFTKAGIGDDNEVRIVSTSLVNTDVSSKVKNDLILINKESEISTSLIISDCIFSDISLDNENSIIHCVSNIKSIKIMNTSITYSGQNTGSNVIKPQSSCVGVLEFIDCTFEKCFDSGAISIQDPLCSNFDIKISECTFLDCYTSENGGGAIAITTNKSVQIENCYFENCRVENTNSYSDIKGGAIFVKYNEKSDKFHLANITINGTITNTDCSAICFECQECDAFFVHDCNFINCKTRCFLGSSYNVLSSPDSVKQFECTNTSFVFDEKSASNPRAVFVESSTFAFDSCSFIRCGSESVDEGGSIFYDGTDSSTETISIINCIFDECHAVDSGAVKLKLNTSSTAPHLSNNSIIHLESVYSMTIEYKNSDLSEIVIFERHKFIGNTGAVDGGGSGVLVNNYHEDENDFWVHLHFINCDFINNYSPNNGGGFGIGSNYSVKSTQLSIESCFFSGNRCDGSNGGGALWIRTSNMCTVFNSIFVNNSSSETNSSNGGAIYLSFSSKLVSMWINNCSFVNNSSPSPHSKGHCIYSTLLYGIIDILFSNFTDNGFGNENPNSVVYTNSELSILYSKIEFTDKEKAFSRAIFIGTSSRLSMRGNRIVNCSYRSGSGAALYYQIVKNRESSDVSIFDNTFINNTASDIGTEMYFFINSSPDIYNCSFYNEDCKTRPIFIQFEKEQNFTLKYDSLCFYNCNFNYNQFVPYFPTYLVSGNNEPFVYTNCEFISCQNIPFLFDNLYPVEFEYCKFHENVNENYFINIKYVKYASITNCEFINITLLPNPSESYTGKVDLMMINIYQVPLTIRNTVFQNIHFQEDNDKISNDFIFQIEGNLHMFDTSLINCSSFKNAIYFNPPIRPVYDEEQQKYLPNSFEMYNCVVDNCGLVSINDWTQQVNVCGSLFANSIDGLKYTSNRPIYSYLVYDVVQFENNVFDGFTNSACIFTVINDIDIRNLTLRNCASLGKYCQPIFKLDVKNKTINHFIFDQFTFENNRFNNSDDQRWMNGGGTGFVLDLAFMNEENDSKEVELYFIDCSFTSNNAELNGGAFAFNDSFNDTKTFLNVLNCSFKDNTCNTSQGSSLCLDVRKLSVENCIFESESNSTIYLHHFNSSLETSKEVFSFNNCSFVSSREHPIHISNCMSEVNISSCSFTYQKDVVYIEQCKSDVYINDCSFMFANEFAVFDDFSQPSCSIYAQTEASFTIKNIVYKVNDQEKVPDYAIACDCNESFIVSDSLLNSCGLCILPNSQISDQIKIANISFKNVNCGFFFQPLNEVRPKASLLITECMFSASRNALKLSLMNDKITFKNNTICDCVNLDESPSKSSFIEIRLDSFESPARFVFDTIKFERNKYLRPKELTKGFSGGIGLNVFASSSGQSFNLEFNECIFVSNEATDGKGIESGDDENNSHSGGCLYYVDDNEYNLSSLSFVGCIFNDNFALGKGGVAYIEAASGGFLLFSNCSFIQNRAGIDAASLFVKNGNNFTLEYSDFVNNSALRMTSSSSLIPADSLSLVPCAGVIIKQTRFIKSVLMDQQTNVQLVISSTNSNSDVKIDVFDSIFTVINPSRSILVLRNTNANSEITLNNNSFTHFFSFNGTIQNKPFSDVSRLLLSARDDFVPIFIDANLSGKIKIADSCFDASSMYSFSGENVGLSNEASNAPSNLVSESQNILKSLKCIFPSEIEEILEIIYDDTESPSVGPEPGDVGNNDGKKKLLIGLIVGIVALVLIVVIVIVIVVVVRKKKKKELENKLKSEAEKDSADENDLEIKFKYATRAMTQENPLFAIGSMYVTDKFSGEESTGSKDE